MTELINKSDAIFAGGPFPHFHRSLGLFRPVGRNTVPRAVLCILLGWLPLLILIIASGIRDASFINSFVTDYGVHARSLIGAPLFILSEVGCLRRLEQVARHFVDSGLVQQKDLPKFKKLVESTRRLVNSTFAEVIAFACAYGAALVLNRYLPVDSIPSWYLIDAGSKTLSWPGWWYLFISTPLLLILIFGWIWRVAVWTRFLFHVSLMKLRLISAHPDRAAGLNFLNVSLLAFLPVAFTFGVISAGSSASRVANKSITLDDVKTTLIGLLIFVLLLFVGPLLVFVFNLYRAKVEGMFHYGQLADALGRQFEGKWTTGEEVGPDALEAPDFSATTDLYQVVANTYNIKLVPFEARALITLCVVTLLPFIPVALMTIPLKVLLQNVAGLLF